MKKKVKKRSLSEQMRDYDLISDLKQVQTFLDLAKGVHIKKIKSPCSRSFQPSELSRVNQIYYKDLLNSFSRGFSEDYLLLMRQY